MWPCGSRSTWRTNLLCCTVLSKLLYYVTVLFVSLASTQTKMEQTEKPKII